MKRGTFLEIAPPRRKLNQPDLYRQGFNHGAFAISILWLLTLAFLTISLLCAL